MLFRPIILKPSIKTCITFHESVLTFDFMEVVGFEGNSLSTYSFNFLGADDFLSTFTH